MTYAIELTGVTKRFARQVAVDQLDLQVPAGSIYGFIGPNGSGKTTTLRMILRIFQPDEGTVRVLGNELGTTADDRLGYLPEERGLYKRMRVRDLLIYYAKLKGNYDCRRDIDFWLKRLEAEEWKQKRIDALSKGMAQKIQFISAVVARPSLAILDEPFTGLDPVNMESLKDSVLWLRDHGTTIVFSTHDMDMAERLCDTIFMIHKGHKVLDGTLDSIQSQFPANRIRVRFADPHFEPAPIDGIEEGMFTGRYYELTIRDHQNLQPVLHQLIDQSEIHHFELIRPSLHDIFVRIARPDQSELLNQ